MGPLTKFVGFLLAAGLVLIVGQGVLLIEVSKLSASRHAMLCLSDIQKQ
jgi:hypothetical protein